METNVAKLPPKKPSTEDAIREFIKRYNTIQNEIATLKDGEKDLFKEYEGTLDTKVLKKAISIAKAMQKIEAKDTFDSYFDVLEKETL
jgi:uncharacterized protein (UPF0335 family)